MTGILVLVWQIMVLPWRLLRLVAALFALAGGIASLIHLFLELYRRIPDFRNAVDRVAASLRLPLPPVPLAGAPSASPRERDTPENPPSG